MKTSIACAIAIAVLLGGARAGAQERGRGETPGPPPVSPAEIQRMFEAYALVQAQDFLKLTDDQYAQFLPRFKALQDGRRSALQERTRVLQDLRRLGNDPQSDENQIRERLKALQDIDARAAADGRKAIDAIDQVLDIRQQARFRLFEEQLERRKLELVTRARQANRGKQ